ncbi:MAG TPA: hypothetical protein VNG33_07650 [Polyangiaceae bacterium]|nr:hypothetical protein [Polyangiaceae bacterium]
MTSFDVEALTARVAERQDALLLDHAPDERVRQQLAKIASGAQRERPRSPERAWLSGLALAALVVLAGGGVWRWRSEPPPLSFSVGDPPRAGVVGEPLRAGAERSPIHFSEGSSVLLEFEARACVVAVGAHGAEVVVDAGRVNVAVVPRPGGDWTLRTGPFTVRVKGTQFDVGYDAALDRFTLRLYHGKVAVSGCGFQDRAVQAGEQLVAACSRHEMSVAPLDMPSSVSAGVAEMTPPPAVVAPAAGAAAPAARPGPNSPPSGRSWVELARAGKYGEAYELARDGFAAECAAGDAERTLLLGETARLSGHAQEARRAYAALRDRFGAAPQAAQAAFALGRLALDAGGDRAAAEHWFSTYLQESPRGPLASAALGRLLELRLDSGDREGAALLARQYLERYPSGPRAAAARQVLEASHVDERR